MVEAHGMTFENTYLRKALPTEFKPLDVVALMVECVDNVSLSLMKSIDESGVNAPFSGPTFSINDVYNHVTIETCLTHHYSHYLVEKASFFGNGFGQVLQNLGFIRLIDARDGR